MQTDFALNTSSEIPGSFLVSSVYLVYADGTYRVLHPRLPGNTWILVYTMRGKGLFTIHDHRYELHSGDLLLTEANDTFLYHTADDCWNFWWFEFSGDSAPAYLNQCHNIGKQDFICDSFSRSLSACKFGSSQNCSFYFASGLAAAYDCIFSKSSYGNLDHFIGIERLIQKELKTITVHRLAESTQLGERTLRNLFYRYAGCSPKEYIKKEKMKTADYLLHSTTKSIYQISEELGYSSQFHFSRTFREYYGIAPSACRSHG